VTAGRQQPLRDALRDRYAIERELGRGGMATVYLAHDLKHDRLIALKVLRPELAAALGPERFLREIHIAARLQHPHILSVHDSGDAAGQLWFTMPYVEGESLRDRLRRDRQLSLDDAIRISTETARALEYAHQHGVIHRDIKPENVLLAADGSTLVADFGIARALGSAGESLTETGLVVGTPAYMSPEQSSGERQLDGRSDQYSLACVVYEMLAGEPPYTGPSAQAIIAKRLSEPIPRLGTVRQVPPEVEAAVTKALAKAPADRYPNTTAFAAALTEAGAAPTMAVAPSVGARGRTRRRAWLMVSLGMVAMLALFFGIQRLASPATLRQTGALGAHDPVVLADFVNRTRDSTLAATLTDAFRVDLGQSDTVRLVERAQVAATLNQMRRAATDPVDPGLAREIAQRQGAKAVVTGEVGAAGTGYVLSAAVVSAADGHTLTAVRTSAPDDRHLIAALDELSSQLRERIGESVSRIRATPPLEQVTTGSLEALRKYSAAWRSGWEAGDYDRALTLLQEATSIDTGFASGYQLMAIAIGNTGGARSVQLDAVTRAYLGRDRLPDYERGWVTAQYQRWVESDVERAISTYRSLLEENGRALGISQLGAMLLSAGRCEEADSLLNMAIDSMPLVAVNYINKAACDLWRQHMPDAAATLARYSRVAPRSRSLAPGRAYLLAANGKLDSALSILTELRRERVGELHWEARAAWGQARLSEDQGRIGDAARYLGEYSSISEARGLPADRLVAAVRLAELELRYRHRADRAISTIEKALRQVPLGSLPVLDRPYLTLARLYAEVGYEAEVRRLVTEYQAVVPAGVRRGQSAGAAAVVTMLALAERRFPDAIAAARTWNRGWALHEDSRMERLETRCAICGLDELAQAFDETRQADSAIAVDAPGIVNLFPEAYALAPAWHRLAQLYETRGQRAEALDAYSHFIARWKTADPALQPTVREARRRMAALAGSH
jgi:tetratricopeptide (TPR) repeat protein